MRHTILVVSTIAVGLLVASGVALLAPSDPASATFPGQNGRIAFQSNRVTQDNPEGDFEIYKMNADGSNPTRLTDDLGIDGESDWQSR